MQSDLDFLVCMNAQSKGLLSFSGHAQADPKRLMFAHTALYGLVILLKRSKRNCMRFYRSDILLSRISFQKIIEVLFGRIVRKLV